MSGPRQQAVWVTKAARHCKLNSIGQNIGNGEIDFAICSVGFAVEEKIWYEDPAHIRKARLYYRKAMMIKWACRQNKVHSYSLGTVSLDNTRSVVAIGHTHEWCNDPHQNNQSTNYISSSQPGCRLLEPNRTSYERDLIQIEYRTTNVSLKKLWVAIVLQTKSAMAILSGQTTWLHWSNNSTQASANLARSTNKRINPD